MKYLFDFYNFQKFLNECNPNFVKPFVNKKRSKLKKTIKGYVRKAKIKNGN